ncbi:TBC1 domain family member 15-like isoform X3 [Pomacea canaliculata]|uniref:TBC1 domain family member 15-like isoform X3 n=1 Tax=Pomacea canaliculata TaxID=400727 RepID=UPI000D73E5A4|nr:TBC1 domain family member 15-like isoform X3 [Pomacea canaliculata]
MTEARYLLTRPCSDDESYEKVDVMPTVLQPPNVDVEGYVSVSNRTSPLSPEQFHKLFDSDGRLVDENQLRKSVFLGGVQPKIRKEVWKFLFGLYPCNSTAREREATLLDNIVKYHELKARWKILLVLSSQPGQTPLQQGIVARYQLPEENPVLNPDVGLSEPVMEQAMDALNSKAAVLQSGSIDLTSLGHADLAYEYSAPEMQQRIEFVQLQARVFVNKKRIDINKLRSSIRVIDKDVPRTDRDVDFFKGHANPHLTQLRDILITFAAYNQLEYAQGMNDVLSRFLYVLGSEAETYWCFQKYMEKVENDFMEEGMVHKIDLVRMLLKETDLPLLKHLEGHDMGNLFFCHRWLLLGFKREFSFLDSLRCFEILSSHHLELGSLVAERVLMMEEMNEFANTGGDARSTNMVTQKEYTFEVFMCVAILMECREELVKCTDNGMVFGFINNLKLDLDDVLTKAEKLFFTYCKKTVSESFQLIDSQNASSRHLSSHMSFFTKTS